MSPVWVYLYGVIGNITPILAGLLIVAAIVMVIVVIASVCWLFYMAEYDDAGKDKKEEMIEQLKMAKEQLSLSEKQELSFREITKKYGIKLKEIKNNDSNKQDKMKMLKESRAAKDAEIKLLLTEEQYGKYLQMLEERRSQMTNRKRD